MLAYSPAKTGLQTGAVVELPLLRVDAVEFDVEPRLVGDTLYWEPSVAEATASPNAFTMSLLRQRRLRCPRCGCVSSPAIRTALEAAAEPCLRTRVLRPG